VLIGSIRFRDRVIQPALGVSTQVNEAGLGLREGSKEANWVVASLLSDLIDLGLDAQRTGLCVRDGRTALRNSVAQTFGLTAPIQR
jgi:putative transposase